MLLKNRTAGDVAFIAGMANQLEASGNVAAAHICHLLIGSAIDGMYNADAKLELVSVQLAKSHQTVYADGLYLTEFVEYFGNMGDAKLTYMHLIPHKLHYAMLLADFGLLEDSAKYCEVIVSFVKTITQ